MTGRGGTAGSVDGVMTFDGPAGRDIDDVAVSGANSSSIGFPAPMVITPPHTEHRARIPAVGIRAGSTRKMERHSGHETFTYQPPKQAPWCAPTIRQALVPASEAAFEPPPEHTVHRSADRLKTRIPAASWRSSSSRSPAR
jgi:hypothetical protein